MCRDMQVTSAESQCRQWHRSNRVTKQSVIDGCGDTRYVSCRGSRGQCRHDYNNLLWVRRCNNTPSSELFLSCSGVNILKEKYYIIYKYIIYCFIFVQYGIQNIQNFKCSFEMITFVLSFRVIIGASFSSKYVVLFSLSNFIKQVGWSQVMLHYDHPARWLIDPVPRAGSVL